MHNDIGFVHKLLFHPRVDVTRQMKILNLENFESWPFVLLCVLTISVKTNEITQLARVLSWCSSPCASACGGAPSDWSCCLCLRPPPASPPSPGWPCPLGRQGPTGCATCAETDGAKKCVCFFGCFFLHSLMASPSGVSWHQLQMCARHDFPLR